MASTEAISAGAVARRQGARYVAPLTRPGVGLWPGRTDTQTIVSSLMLSLAMTAVLQFGQGLDTVMFGGLFPVWGRVLAFVFIALATLMYGLVGGLITAWINPAITVATGTSPIAPFFFLTNGLIVIGIIIAARFFKDNAISWRVALGSAVMMQIFMIIAYPPLHLLYFHLPVEKLISMYTFQTVTVIPLSTVLLRGVLEVVKGAGFVREEA